ncbi:hypothetical protein J2T17_000360 [Paenibacillus mucilaginosus]|uniref:hypothetical protein n=1 Tax=Paenibacillus mucilaginosus TaxID=61624 RepID=UPI003D1DC0A7
MLRRSAELSTDEFQPPSLARCLIRLRAPLIELCIGAKSDPAAAPSEGLRM